VVKSESTAGEGGFSGGDCTGSAAFPSLDTHTLEAITAIDALVRSDPGGRGLASRAPANPLVQAGSVLASSRRIVIATGFCIRACMIGETDGPPGAACLARALRSPGRGIVVVTDRHSEALVVRALAVQGSDASVLTIPQDQTEADKEIRNLLADFDPDCIVAIERPGSAADGSRYSMRAEKLDDLVPSLDLLFEPDAVSVPYSKAARPGPVTIAVGDGGNELGMGSLPAKLRATVPHGDTIFAASGAAYPIVAGVSNWGAWALAACALLWQRTAASGGATGSLGVLPLPDTELEVLRSIVDAGAVDGSLKTRRLGVDGLDLTEYLEVIRGIHALWQKADAGFASDGIR
jgi:hypothetical protein